VSLPAGSLWLDAQGAQSRTHFDRGIPRYIVEQLRAVWALEAEAVGAVGLGRTSPLTSNLHWLLGTGKLQWCDQRPPARLPRIFHVMSPLDLDQRLDDLWPAWARSTDVTTVVTLYDLIPLVFREHYLNSPRARTQYMSRLELVRQAGHVLAISEATARDAVELLGVPERRITVVDAGVATGLSLPGVDGEQALDSLRGRLPTLRPGFMLYVAGIEFRKNIERLIEAYARMSPDVRARHQLVITCSVTDETRAALEGHARFHGVGEGEFLMTGYIEDQHLAALYRACRLFVFASFYEGSGLPILEAMAAGAPVAASNTSTSPEILGDLEATFDPFDPDDIADCLSRVIQDDELLKRLRRRSSDRVKHYTWEHVAGRTLEGYEEALRARPVRRRRRARIALVSPWPPEQSGIADYNQRLAARLGEQVDVDVIVEQPLSSYVAPRDRGVRLLPAGCWDVAERLLGYDRVVYCMGNSSFHGYMYEAMRRRPGIIVAHDVRFTGFYGWWVERERPENPVGRLCERLDQMYGERIDASLFMERPPSPAEQEQLGLYMSQDLQRHAERVLVHSRFAADILRLDRAGADDIHTEIGLIPYALPEPRPRPPRPDGPFPLIVTMGVVSSVKGLDTLLEAMALLRCDYPQARLIIGGPGSEEELSRWRGRAHHLGMESAVELTGHLSPERYYDLLGRADLAVQLRTLFNGEASGAVADCLACGVPTVATFHGWATELAPDILVGVPPGIAPRSLAKVLGDLAEDEPRRAQLTERAQSYVAEHGFDCAADAYMETLGLRAAT
jgi:glycosyltransferase involved in cell wall biosynthesis